MTDKKENNTQQPTSYDAMLSAGKFNKQEFIDQLTPADKSLLAAAHHEHNDIGPKIARTASELAHAAVGIAPSQSNKGGYSDLDSEVHRVVMEIGEKHKKDIAFPERGDPMSLPLPANQADVSKLSQLYEETGGGTHAIPSKTGRSR